MRILSYFTLIGAAITLLRSGADAFTLDRSNSTSTLVIDDSHETATDNFLDSAESNQTSIETNDSLEVVIDTRLVVKSDPIGHQTTPIADQQPIQFRVDRDYSWEDLIDDISELDRTQPPVGSQPTGLAQFAVDHDDSIEDVIEDLADARRILGIHQTSVSGVVAQQNVPAAAVGPVAHQPNLGTPTDGSSFSLFVEDDDDFSLEDYADFFNPHAIHQLTATNFHHLPDTLFSHPKTDDWFLVKHFMDDHYVWELGDELAKEYFWQPVKAPEV